MTLKVIGAGFGRTGTLSLKTAIEHLRLGRCYHMVEVFPKPSAPARWEAAAKGEAVDWAAIFKGFSATVDWPSCNFYDVLAARYPKAKIILTLRDPNAWFDSMQKTIFPTLEQRMAAEPETTLTRMLQLIVADKFDGRIHDRAHCIAVFEAHRKAVERSISADRLLVYEVSDGWQPLCDFLGLPVPAAPFPKTNSAKEFAQHASAALQA